MEGLLDILFGEEHFSQPIQRILPDSFCQVLLVYLEAVYLTQCYFFIMNIVHIGLFSLLGSVNENQRPSNSYNGDLNGLLVPDPIVAGDGPSLAKPVHRSISLGALQEKQVM